MTDWIWVDPDVAIAVHEAQLAEHGGPGGVRDANAFQSAMARPQELAAYGDPDAASLAASYAFGFARNHAFVDGNKRTAWVLARMSLALNGMEIAYTATDAVALVLVLAAGEISEDELAGWFRERIVA